MLDGGFARSLPRPLQKRIEGMRAAIEALESRRLMSVGGGFTGAGATGSYFNNTTLSGSPSFTRQDDRIDFSWQNAGPGGSAATGFKNVAARNFSARWTGQVLPRFSENYAFTATADAGVRFYIKPAGASSWTTLIDHWTAHAAAADGAGYAMTAGQAYDIKLEYWDDASAGTAKLEWASRSTPRELIEPESSTGINIYNDGFADRMKTARDEWQGYDGAANQFTGSTAPRDANGWPLSDAEITVWEGVDENQGTCLLQFKGQAQVQIQFGFATVTNQKYDAASNTTTANVIVAEGMQNFSLILKNTRRTAGAALNSGVTDVKLMRPTVVGGDTPYPITTTFSSDYLAALSRYTTLRAMAGTNWNDSVDWTDRTTPGYSTQHLARPTESGFETNGMAWEYRVELANETGKDLYINIPETASDDYITKLAQLMKYGSDGVNPYTSPQASPVFAPLNSNLRLYVEYSNEVWNFAFGQWAQNYDAAQSAVSDGTPDGKILTYDGNSNTNVLANRRQALRTVDASNLFRAVFGNADMGSRIRPVLEWQYDNAGFPATAQTQLTFINNYFDNGDGVQHVAAPHPVSYYLWGGGGANYYSGVNPAGDTSLLSDGATSLEGIDGNNSQFSISFTVPESQVSSVYALSFQAAQRSTEDSSDNQSFDVLVDGISVSSGNTAQNWYQPGSTSSTYATNIFTADPGSTHTVTFIGESSTGDQVALIDNVKLTSADAIFAADIPASGNNGNSSVSSGGYQGLLNTEVNWAKLYGLHEVAYEGGWALGGDFGSTPLQNWVKFNDPRTLAAERSSIDAFNQSGGDLNLRGTYIQWTDWASAASDPLPRAVDASIAALRSETTNGIAASVPLTQANRTLDDNDNNGALFSGGWIDWNVLIPSSGNYQVTANTAAGGAAQLSADDVTLLASGISGASLGGTTFFTQGLHTVRIKCIGGSFALNQVILVGAAQGNLAPTIAAPAAASSDPVIGSTTDLSVLGADDGGEAGLTYTWSVTQGPADVAFTSNNTNAAKNTTASFSQPGDYTFVVAISDGALATTSSVDVVVSQVSGDITAAVVGRYIYYNNSYWNDSSFGRSDNMAIDANKSALLPGQTAGFANYSGSLQGINGIVVDIANLPSDTLTTDDFSFAVGNDSQPDGWTAAPNPVSITVRRGQGVNGSDRIVLTWDDNAIRNQWLQITVNANADTGLSAPDVFYFGNQVGETGNSASDTFVDASDMVAVRDHLTPLGSHAAASNRFDLNHDGFVDASDMVVVRDHVNDSSNRLRLITPPSAIDAPLMALPAAGQVALATFSAAAAPPPAILPPSPSRPTSISASTAIPAGTVLPILSSPVAVTAPAIAITATPQQVAPATIFPTKHSIDPVVAKTPAAVTMPHHRRVRHRTR